MTVFTAGSLPPFFLQSPPSAKQTVSEVPANRRVSPTPPGWSAEVGAQVGSASKSVPQSTPCKHLQEPVEELDAFVEGVHRETLVGAVGVAQVQFAEPATDSEGQGLDSKEQQAAVKEAVGKIVYDADSRKVRIDPIKPPGGSAGDEVATTDRREAAARRTSAPDHR